MKTSPILETTQDISLRRKMKKFETTCIHLEKESKSMA